MSDGQVGDKEARLFGNVERWDGRYVGESMLNTELPGKGKT